MAGRRKKSDQEALNTSVVPEYIQAAPLLNRRKITKRKLPSFTEAMLLLHAPEALRLYWEAIFNGLKKGDKTALEAAGEIFNYTRGKGINLNLTQQMMANNVAAGEQAPVMGYDALVRNIAEARAGHTLPAPATVIEIGQTDTTVTQTVTDG